MKVIRVGIDGYSSVDDSEYDKLVEFKWFKISSYAGCRIDGDLRLMHRLVIRAKDDELVDHIDGNVLNNQRSNLRICTHAQNMRNRKIAEHNKCGFKGVYQDKRKGKRGGKSWRAEIRYDKQKYCLGIYATPEEAYRAYCRASIKYHGEFGRT